MQIYSLLMLASLALAEDSWPRFRGPNGAGVGAANALPTEFGPSRNVAWKTKVPFGRSSPIVTAKRVFLTASEGGKLLTLAYDATTGRPLWRRELAPARTHQIYKANDPASPTPAADEGNVYAFFPDFGLISYTFAGKERWRHPLGPFGNFYGMSSSPVVAGGLVLLLCDQERGSFLIALDKETGVQRWKTERPSLNVGWSVPIVHDGQVLAFGTSRIDSYFLTTGESSWWIPLSSNGSMGTPVLSGDSVIVTAAGFDQPWLPAFRATADKLDVDKDDRLSVDECKDEKEWFEHFGWVDANHDRFLDEAEWNVARNLGIGDYGAVAIPLGGRGRLESSAIRWRFKRNLPYVAAPLLYDHVLYMVKDGGIVTTLDPATGKLLKQGRAPNAPGQYFASPVASGGKVLLLSEEGKLTILTAGSEWTPLALIDFEEECYATPAIAAGKLFVRTRTTLYAFTATASPPTRH